MRFSAFTHPATYESSILFPNFLLISTTPFLMLLDFIISKFDTTSIPFVSCDTEVLERVGLSLTGLISPQYSVILYNFCN